jgi:MSHA biogenesis protein MshQ
MKKLIQSILPILALAHFMCGGAASATELSGTINVDNYFDAYISTDDSVQGALLGSGTEWTTTYAIASTLNPGQDYFLHIRGIDEGGRAGFLGDFELSGTDHKFANGLASLSTNVADWVVSTSGWSAYQPASAFGANGVSPWGNRASTASSAQWIWSSNNDADNAVYFSTRIVAQIARPIADYRFDEESWNGVADEVFDNSGNGNTGSAVGGVTTVLGKICNAAEIPSNTDRSIYEAVDTSVDLDSMVGSSGTISLWYKANSAWASGSDKRLFDATDGDKYFIGEIGSDGRVKFWFEDGNDGDYQKTTVNAFTVGAGVWKHLTFVWDVTNNTAKIFVDGVEQSLSGRDGGTAAFRGFDTLYFGDNRDASYFTGQSSADGLIDEALVFDSVLTSADIQTIFSNQDAGKNYDGSLRTCPTPSAIPVLEYRFDTCSYDATPGDVFDQTGSFSGTSNGIPPSSNDTIINQSLDLRANNTSDWVSVPSGAVDGLDDFSVSVWFKTAVNKTQQEIFHALGANTGDDELEIHLRNNNAVVVKVKDVERSLASSIVLTDDNWHHLAIVREAQNICLFIDGAQQSCTTSASTGELSVNNANAIVIGQEQDQFGGGFSTAQNFEGQLDEFKLYDVKLSDNIVTSIYENELAGANYDASARSVINCNYICSAPGTFNSVGIKIGNGGSDTQINSTTEAFNIHAAWLGAGSPVSGSIIGGTYNVTQSGSSTVDRIDFGGAQGAFAGTLAYPSIGAVGNQSFSHFLVHSSGTMSLPAGDYTIYVESDDGFSFVMETLSGDTVVFNKFGLSTAGASNELRFEGPTGNARSGGSFSLTQDSVFSVASIFFERDGGDFMEVSIANSIIATTSPSAYEILRDGALSGKVKFGCPVTSQINHYQIIHDGQGLTCAAETVTINACTNAYDGSCTLSDEAVTLDIRATGSTSLVDTVSFIGTGNASIPYTVAETVVLSLENASIAAVNPVICSDGSSNNCNIVFADAGFRFLNGSTGLSNTITNQISGTTFPLRVQAVQNNDGVCEGLFDGNKSITLSQENVDPSGTAGLSFSVNGTDIAKRPGTSTTTLNFGADSIAFIPTPIYHDAGQIRLHADYNVGGITLSGNSNAFWVSPAELVITAKSGANDLDGAIATASRTHKAGDDFELSVTAFNSQGLITPNYSPGQIQLRLQRTGPTLSDSVDGALSYAGASLLTSNASPIFQDVTLSSFAQGVSTYANAHYSEVGLLNLDVQDSNYGNAGIVVPATAINIGRFIPDHFQQTIEDDGYLTATCNTSTAFSAYSGQKDEATNSIGAISYLTNPVLAITAYNKQGNITQNYYQDTQGSANDFMKLNVSNVSINVPILDQTALGVDTNQLPLTANMTEGTLSQNDLTALPGVVALAKGVLHYQLSDADNFFYNRSANALVAPFTSDIDFSVASIVDTDNVSVTTTVDASPAGVEIRFGRLVLSNSFGPETANFPQPMQLEHFDGTGFIVSSDNNCSGYDASKLSLSNISLDPALAAKLGGAGSFQLGKTQAIELAAPGMGNQGQIGVSYDAYDWLKYDWDADGVFDDSPSAIATFGVFRGNDRIIHWREVFEE